MSNRTLGEYVVACPECGSDDTDVVSPEYGAVVVRCHACYWWTSNSEYQRDGAWG